MSLETSIEVVKPVIKDSIEFYVSNDGLYSGMSAASLAKLCDIALQGLMQNVLLPLNNDSTKQPPKQLECLRGKVFYTQLSGNKGAKIVASEACAIIIEYYAFESRAKSELAVIAYRQFAKLGIDRWIKQVTNFQEQTAIASSDSQVLSALSLLTSEVAKLSVKVEKLDNFQRTTVSNLPGLNQMFDSYSQDIVTIDSSTFTLKEWLANKGLTLDHSGMCSLGRLVADAYKFNRQQETVRESQWKRDRSGTGQVTVYRACDEPILEVALQKFLKP